MDHERESTLHAITSMKQLRRCGHVLSWCRHSVSPIQIKPSWQWAARAHGVVQWLCGSWHHTGWGSRWRHWYTWCDYWGGYCSDECRILSISTTLLQLIQETNTRFSPKWMKNIIFNLRWRSCVDVDAITLQKCYKILPQGTEFQGAAADIRSRIDMQ